MTRGHGKCPPPRCEGCDKWFTRDAWARHVVWLVEPDRVASSHRACVPDHITEEHCAWCCTVFPLAPVGQSRICPQCGRGELAA